MTDSNNKKWLTNLLFIVYLIALFWIIVFKFNVQFSPPGKYGYINLVPFVHPLVINGKLVYSEIIMNVVIFMPLGIYAGIIFERWIIAKKIFLFFLISLICEGLQLILGVGVFDVTDIITNTLGGIFGLILYKGIERIFSNDEKARKFINILAIVGTILMILFISFLKIKRLWIFRR